MRLPLIGIGRRANRYRQVLAVLTRHGFGEVFNLIAPSRFRRRPLRGKSHTLADIPMPHRVRHVLEELGPTYVKLGQMLSTRPDLISEHMIRELEKLQAHVRAEPFETIKMILERELGRSIEDVFDFIEEQPVAAASLAQVHRARLKSGEIVAIKVLRPDIRSVARADVDIMYRLAHTLERYSEAAKKMHASQLVAEFGEEIEREMDLRVEYSNLRRFADNFAGTPYVHVPRTFSGLCTRNVLVMEFIEGIPVSQSEALRSRGYDLPLLAQRNSEIWMKATMEHGFFHADPHPGNIMVLPDNVICVLDYGMMGTVGEQHRESFVRLLFGIAYDDETQIARAIEMMVEKDQDFDSMEIAVKVRDIANQSLFMPVEGLRMGPMFNHILRVLREHDLALPAYLMWLVKAIANTENAVHRLDPDFDFMESAMPYVERALWRQLNPFHHIRSSLFTLGETARFVRELPRELATVLHLLSRGRLKTEFEHVGLEPLRATIDRSISTLAIGLVTAGLLIASSVVVLAGVPPRIGEIPVLGMTGYIIGGILGVVFVVSLLRNRNRGR